MKAIYVDYDPYNRLGNRMFQYAMGYILSKKYNCPLYTDEGLPNFGIEPNPGKPVNDKIFSREKYDQLIDLSDIKPDTNFVINGWCQKAEYFIDHRDELRKVFGIRNLDTINKDSLIVHIRETDYKSIGAFLGYELYKELINDSGYTDIKIVTDNPKGETIQRLLSEGCTLCTDGDEVQFSHHGDGRAMADFKTLLYSENIAISQSSFAWWGAFLGYHKKIIFPYNKDIKWWPIEPGKDDIDLYFDFDNTCSKYIK